MPKGKSEQGESKRNKSVQSAQIGRIAGGASFPVSVFVIGAAAAASSVGFFPRSQWSPQREARVEYCVSMANQDLSGAEGAKKLRKLLFVSADKLNSIIIRNCRIGHEGVAVIASILPRHQCFRTIDLTGNELGHQEAKVLIEALLHTPVTHLLLPGNRLGDAGAIELAKGLEQAEYLTVVDVSDNQIGDAGVAALQQAVSVVDEQFRQMSCFISRRNYVHHTGAGSSPSTTTTSPTAAASSSASATTTLAAAAAAPLAPLAWSVDGRQLSGDGLDLTGANLGILRQALLGNTLLHSISLCKCRIDRAGARLIADALITNQQLVTLNLTGCGLRYEEIAIIAGALPRASILNLFLAGNQIVMIGHPSPQNYGRCAIALAEGVSLCKNLTVLDVSYNNIGDTEAWALTEAALAVQKGHGRVFDLLLECNNIHRAAVKQIESIPAGLKVNLADNPGLIEDDEEMGEESDGEAGEEMEADGDKVPECMSGAPTGM